MNYKEALEYLDRFQNYEKTAPKNYSAELSLERIQSLLEKIGNPHRRYSSLHVAGTKGKGSTCAFAASILQAHGVRTGRYTSPHLFSIRERIQVDGEPISEEDFAEIVDSIRPHTTPEATYFDVTTACAFLHFMRSNVEAAVVEVGLGGRLDSTNVLTPAVSALTPISLDHTDQLGADIRSIALEKAGIIKPGVPVVVAPQPEEALVVFVETAAVRQAPVHLIEKETELLSVTQRRSGSRFRFWTPVRDYAEASIPLLGRHQVSNALTAVRMIELWGQRVGRSILTESVLEGLRAVVWPGRCQLVEGRPAFLLDGAHNAASAQVLRDTVLGLFPGRQVRLVLGISADKDLEGITGVFAPLGWEVIATRAAVSRAESPEKIAAFFKNRWGKKPIAFDSVGRAIEAAVEKAGADDLIVITGSLFVVGEALEFLGMRSSAFSGAAFLGKESLR